ncbi:hypothetical protein LY76DRAFT_673650 [Colletotrichum caudatum]|nr:hypothetical protein LY76DRAFT_673650 [Colletotrichum caudatum]
MASMKHPPVPDCWDCHDFDGDPAHRLDRDHHSFAWNWGTTSPIRRQPSNTALGQPQCLASVLSNDWKPIHECYQAGDMPTMVPIHGDLASSVHPLDLVTMECPAPELAPPHLDTLPESLSDFGMPTSGAHDACLTFPTPRRSKGPEGIMMAPSYVVKLLDRPSKPDSACPQDFTQPTPFANHLAQHIAESTTLYHQDTLFQQPLASETELSCMPAATFDVGRLASDDTTPFPRFNPPSFLMAVITTDWPYGAWPVSAAHHDMDDNMAQQSPLSELYEMPDETDDWAVLMQQDTLFTGAFEMASFDYPAVDTDYQTTGYQASTYQTTDHQTTASPQNIFNDPAIQYDIEQSLQTAAFDFNDPLPDLSAYGYLSGADQISPSFGSTNTSPFEPVLDFFPLLDPSASFVFPDSTDISPADTTTTPTTAAGTASPGSDAASTGTSAVAHPFRCATDGCAKSFRKEAQLKQHQRVHRKALVCDICRAEGRPEHKFAQVRDLERHLQARHRDVAERTNVRSEVRRCPHPGCEHEGRRDNVSRHHKSKHGKELKWKRSVPHVVG